MQGLHNMYAAWLYPQHSSTLTLLTLTQPGDDKQRHHRGPKDLSNEPHYSPEAKHNPDYDHEAFLGKEQAERFDQLPPEEARRRLGCVCMTVTYLSMAALYTHWCVFFSCPAHAVWLWTKLTRMEMARSLKMNWETGFTMWHKGINTRGWPSCCHCIPSGSPTLVK